MLAAMTTVDVGVIQKVMERAERVEGGGGRRGARLNVASQTSF
jgi:hypothetical protein